MLQEILTVGDKIDLRQLDHTGGQIHNVRTYVSQLVDLIDADVISIAAPMRNNKMIILEVGEWYNLCFYSSKGLYQCNCTLMNNRRENNLIVSVVRLSSDLEKVQRRQYYRLECIHEVDYRIISMEEELLDNKVKLDNFKNTEERSECRKKLMQMNSEWLRGSITDISGGGARFNSYQVHQPGERVRIKFDFLSSGELKKLVLGSEIIYADKLINQSGAYEYRVEFKDIGKRDREDLIKYIFEQERHRRRNNKS